MKTAVDSTSEAIICEKARQLHADLLTDKPGTSGEGSEVFKASHRWFDKFKKRTGIHSVVRLEEEPVPTKTLPKAKSPNLGSMWRLRVLSPNKCLTEMRLVCSGRKCLTEATFLKRRRHCQGTSQGRTGQLLIVRECQWGVKA